MSNNLAFREEPKFEIIDGKVKMMSPRPHIKHNLVSSRIYGILEDYFNNKRCVPFPDGTTLALDDQNHFIPDAMVICDKLKFKGSYVLSVPTLVVEVLSPSTMESDRGKKMEAYARAGVKEYWIADSVNTSIEQYILQDARFVLHGGYTLYSKSYLDSLAEYDEVEIVESFKSYAFPDLECKLTDIFGILFMEDFFEEITD